MSQGMRHIAPALTDRRGGGERSEGANGYGLTWNGHGVENLAIEHITHLNLTLRDFDHMDEDTRAGILLLCHASNECNMLMRMHLACSFEETKNNAVDSMAWGIQFFIIRTWTAKAFEAIDMLQSCGRDSATGTWASECRSIIASISALDNLTGYNIARDIRNEVANHFSHGAAKKNLRHINADADMSIFLSEQNGNCYYSGGDNAIFIARLSRHQKGKQLSVADTVNSWLDWVLKVTDVISLATSSLILKYLLDRTPDRTGKHIAAYVPFSMVHTTGCPSFPVFVRSGRRSTDEK